MGRAPCCDKQGLKKGPWTPDEDQKLVSYIQQHGHGSWRALPKQAGLLRCGKSCRLRWTNYLRPDIKRGRFTLDEEQLIIHLHAILGNRWSAIAAHLAGRTDNEIKNYWNTHLKKRLLHLGIDPVTHKATQSTPLLCSKLSHIAQWDSARIEAEARLARHATPDSFLRLWKAQTSASVRSSTASSVHLPSFLQQWEQPVLTSEPFRRNQTPAPSISRPPTLDFDSAGAALLLNHLTSASSGSHLNSTERIEVRPFQRFDGQESSLSSSSDGGGIVQGDGLMQCERMMQGSSTSLASFPPAMADTAMLGCPGFVDCGTMSVNSSASLWQQPLVQLDSGASMSSISDDISQCGSVLSEDESSSNYGALLPPDVLMDLVDGAVVSSCKSHSTVADWPDVSQMESKDYWSNMLKLVGPPCQER